jgi:hypothetical protein
LGRIFPAFVRLRQDLDYFQNVLSHDGFLLLGLIGSALAFERGTNLLEHRFLIRHSRCPPFASAKPFVTQSRPFDQVG